MRRLTAKDFVRELEEIRLRIRQRLLQDQLEQISSLGDLEEMRRLFEQLVDTAQRMGAIDQQLPPEREKAGTR